MRFVHVYVVVAEALWESLLSVREFATQGKTHGTINSDLGLPDDKLRLVLRGRKV